MLTEEQKARLNPEQLAIAEQWEVERAARLADINALEDASKYKDEAEYRRILEKIQKDIVEQCAHERSWASNCSACTEIEMLLHPELFCKECEQPGNKYLNPLDENGICTDCRD